MNCLRCEKQLTTKDKRTKYCSLQCSKTKDRSAVCATCSVLFKPAGQQKYCSRSCSAKANNAGRTRHGVPSVDCKGCSGKAPGRPNAKGYCTTACRQQHEIDLWLSGTLDGNWKYTHAAYVQRYLEGRSGLVCEMLGCTEQRKRPNGSHILQVDHINGDWRDNSVKNVRLICPSCHSLTDTWGAGNMGNGRKWRATYSQY